jgi:hypothetical protein
MPSRLIKEQAMYAKDLLQERLKPFHPGDGREDRSAATFVIQTLVLLVSLFGSVFCLTSLYLAMRGIMRLGGMVASGGPYAIAHPAPGWTWLIPCSILAGLIFIGLNAYASHRVGGFEAVIFAWPALFLSLGWNFLEFAFKGGGGHGIVWGWLVCGVIFIPMGAIPLLFILSNAGKAVGGKAKWSRSSLWSGADDSGSRGSRVRLGRTGRVVLILLQLGSCGLGIFGSARFVQMLTAEKSAAIVDKVGAATTSVPSPPAPSSSPSSRMALPLIAHYPRLVMTYEHNTLEIQSGEDRVFYNGKAYDDPKKLPLEARQILEQTADMLRVLLKY